MTREEKIKLLTDIQKGRKPIAALSPALAVCLVEANPGFYTEADQKRVIPTTNIQNYLSLLRQEHPQHIINTTFIHHEEFERISAELEAAY